MGEWCDWPASGQVTFRRVSMPGGDIDPEPLDLEIPSGQKVTLVKPMSMSNLCLINTNKQCLEPTPHMGRIRLLTPDSGCSI